MKNNNLDIIIVNYNFGNELLECLESIKKVKDEANINVWVVDNASWDDSIERAKLKFPEANYILNENNFGFGRASNQGLVRARGEYLLCLNPDARLEKGVLSYLLDYLEAHPGVGAATAKIVLESGQVDLTAHRGFPTPWASLLYFLGDDSLYHLTKKNLKFTHEVDAISGAFFLTRKSVLEKVGYFDEDYFMYAEDIDLSFRIKEAGYKIMYVPEVQILHKKGVASGLKKHSQNISTATRESKIRAFNAFYQTMKIFYRKHYATKNPFFINWLVILGINLRWWMAKRRLVV